MNGKISYRVISYLTEVLFGNSNVFALLVPAYKIQGERLYHTAICPDYTKTLQNPDTHNRVYTCSLRKSGGGNIQVFNNIRHAKTRFTWQKQL
jgi:hypothetical protein